MLIVFRAILLLLLFCAGTTGQPPAENPAGCRNRCHRGFGAAYNDCRNGPRRIAGCHVTRCEFNKDRNLLGHICAPISPTPTPSPSTFPGGGWIDRTFQSDVLLEDDRVEPATDGSSVSYRIVYNMTVTNRGVVSLSGVSEYTSVSCKTDGTVSVTLSPEAPVSLLREMYPIGSVLIIDRDVFGTCKLTSSVNVPGETEDEARFRRTSDKSDQFESAFLFIESVSGNPRSAIIKGTPTTFFAVFDRASIRVNPVSTVSSRVVLPVSARAVNLDFESNLLSLGPLKLRVKGKGVSEGEFVSFTADWDLFSSNIEFKFINQWTLNVDLDATLSGSAAVTVKTWELLSIPLYGLPKLDFLKKFNSDSFSFPSLKLGFFFEVPLLVRVGGKIEKKVGNVATAKYTTTRTEVTLFLRGPWISPDIGATSKQLAPSSKSFKFQPSLSANEPTEISFSVFAGIRPQFIAYALLFQSRVSVEAGVELEGKWDSSKNTAFPPVVGGGNTIGRCRECHDVEIAGKGKIQNAGIYAQIGLKIEITRFRRNFTIPISKQLASIQLPGNPSVSVDIATGCFVEPKGDKGPLNFIAENNKCEACPDEKPKYNPTRQECEEECPDPDKPFFNKATQQCEPCPPETPTYNKDLEVCEGKCPGGTRAGNNVPFFGSFELGKKKGQFVFEREHFTVKDRTEVFYENKKLIDTGCTGGFVRSTKSFNGNSTNVIVKVTPNCGGTSGTAWNFKVFCPS